MIRMGSGCAGRLSLLVIDTRASAMLSGQMIVG